MGQALRLAEDVSRAGDGLELALAAFLTNTQTPGGVTRKYDLHPASHLHPGMIVPVEVDGRIEDDEIVRVDWQDYAGPVYDLNVDKVHTYIANGIVVHNSIYGWRGADPRNIIRLREDFPDMRQVLLERNYRSTQVILDAANEVIKHNWQRTPKKLFTDKEGGPLVTVYQAYDEMDEASFVVDEIARLGMQGLATPGDCVILYRTNAQSRALEDAFVRRNLPYRLVGATRFYERKEIKDAIAYLRLVHNPDDSLSLQRIINEPPRRIGKTSVTTLVQWAAQLGLSQTEALRVLSGERGQLAIKAKGALLMDNAPFSNAAKTALLGFWRLLAAWIAGKDGLTVGQLLDRILEESGYATFVRDGTEEGEGRWENLQELRTVAANYADLPIGDGLAAFLEEIALVSDQDELPESQSVPTLDDPAHGQRLGVPGGLCRRHGGGDFSSQPQQGRPRPHAGGASPGLRRHHAGQALSLSGARLQTHAVRQLGDVPTQPVPGRYPPAFDQRQGHARTQRPGPHDRSPIHGGAFHDLEPVAVLKQPAGRSAAKPICSAIAAGRRAPAPIQTRPTGDPRPFWRGCGDQDRISRRRRIRQRRLCRQGRQEADGEPGEAESDQVGWLA